MSKTYELLLNREAFEKSEVVTSVEGVKYDQDKPRYDLLPPHALEEVVKNLTFGAKKYAPENWKKVDQYQSRYFAAAQRHMWAYKRGEILDPENDLHHLAAAIVNLMFILDLELVEKQKQLVSEVSEILK